MDFVGKLFGKSFVDGAVSGDKRLSGEGVTHQGDVKMRVAGAHGMAMAFIDDVEMRRQECLGQCVADVFLHGIEVLVAMA